MSWFKCKQKIIKVEPDEDNLPRMTTINQKDTFVERARNIWQHLGFVNDRFGAIPEIANVLEHYARLDRVAEDAKKKDSFTDTDDCDKED